LSEAAAEEEVEEVSSFAAAAEEVRQEEQQEEQQAAEEEAEATATADLETVTEEENGGEEGGAAEEEEAYQEQIAAEGGEEEEVQGGDEGEEQAATADDVVYEEEEYGGGGGEGEGEGEGGEEEAVEEEESQVQYYECPFTTPFDKKGAIYWVGTYGHTEAFENPQLTGLIYLEISTLYRGHLLHLTSYAEQTTAADRIAAATYTNNAARSWIIVDFGPDRRLRPSYYCLKHGASGIGNAIRNWMLEGKEDEDGEWVLLREHKNDTSMREEPQSVAAYEISKDATKSSFFRIFRLTQTGRNSGNNDCLFIGGIDFYGILQVC